MTVMNYVFAAEALRVVAHPIRLKMIEILKNGEMSVSAIQSALLLKQSITSQHLNIMKNKGILSSRRKGNIVYYSILNTDVVKIISCIRSCKNRK